MYQITTPIAINPAEVQAISDEDVATMVQKDPVTPDDLREARKSTSKSFGSAFGERYERWMREYGSA